MAALQTYREKRNFKTTPEPRGKTSRSKKTAAGGQFVIQKHAARRLHYDLRLEVDGVLKSWAVTRGPSLIPGEKRLAVHVEDHPLDYGGFEGSIPKGSYGAGTVIVWDNGAWKPIGDAAKGFDKGHLEFEMEGQKLSGRWHLIRMKGKPREKRENWLLIKGEDDAARTEKDADILKERPESVKTGKTIEEMAATEDAPTWDSSGKGSAKKGAAAKAAKPAAKSTKKASPLADPSGVAEAKKGRMPGFIEPTLATLTAKAPTGGKWLHEVKFDGYRLQARIDGKKVKLLTRSGLDWTERFGDEIVRELGNLAVDQAIFDGELVVETSRGASDFSALQSDLSEGRTDRFRYYLFDLLYQDGYDLRGAALEDRKTALEKLIGEDSDVLRYSGHLEESGDVVFRHACRLSLEGMISKDRTAPYRSGRGKTWLKAKCSARQEFVIAGYVPSTAYKKAIGSLVLGVHENGMLVHVGRVGTGFSRQVAERLRADLDRTARKTSPFAKKLDAAARRDVVFVKPEMVAEVEFRGWTGDGNLRHSAFRGIREDKPAKEIIRETPSVTETDGEAEKPERTEGRAEGRTVKLTHPDRLYWPDAGVTKEGLADYYAAIWPHIGPYIVGRPLSLLRCPEGIVKSCFFQKHAWKGMHKKIRTVKDPQEADDEPFVAIDDLDGLLGLVQGGSLEIHPWQASLSHWEKPDMIVMDLDPDEAVEWSAVADAARDIKERLEDAGLAAFVKTSGGKGLHVVSPTKPRANWDEHKAFTKAIADQMAKDDPERYVSTVSKAKRKGKILVDYLRNGRGATAVCVYTPRARPGAPVSMPVSWDEIDDIGPADFTVENAPQRLAKGMADPWEDFFAAAKPLPKAKKGG